MQANTNDVEVSKDVTEDPSSLVTYELKLELMNARLSPAQRAALHKLLVGQARQLRMAVMFALTDQKAAKATLVRKSNWKGSKPVPFFEE